MSFTYPGTSIQQPYGTMWYDGFQRADSVGSIGSNYTYSGAATASITSNQAVISGGTSSASFVDRITLDGYGFTLVNSWKQVIRYTVASTTGSTFLGVGQTFQSVGAGTGGGYAAGLLISAGTGTARIYKNATSFSIGNTMSVALNDVIRVEFTYSYETFTVVIYNETKNLSCTTSATNQSTTGQLLGKFNLLVYAGTQNLISWTITTNEIKNADIIWMGDSITKGYMSTGGYADKDSFSYKTSVILNKSFSKFAHVNAVSADILSVVPEVVRFSPKSVCLMIGGNDIIFAVPPATYQANIKSIINTFKLNGIKVILLYATPRNGSNITSINTFFDGLNTANVKVVNLYKSMQSGGTTIAAYQDADNTHLSKLGHTYAAQIIATVLRGVL